MRSLIREMPASGPPEAVVERLRGLPGVVLLQSALAGGVQGRYSFVAANPFLVFRACGSRCEIRVARDRRLQFGNPWQILGSLLARYELLDEIDLPFPLGGCFGYWGYDLKNFVEPRLPRRAIRDLELPDCHVGFYDSLVIFDHELAKSWIVSTGLDFDGSRSEARAHGAVEFWEAQLRPMSFGPEPEPSLCTQPATGALRPVTSNLSRLEFLAAVERAQRYIQAGDIYQVNLAQRLTASWGGTGWQFYKRLSEVSPAPFAAYLDCGDFEVVSSSPELFLRLSGAQVHTRPIKGTRPRSADSDRDARFTYELQTSAKEMAELVMITDLLRNDLGRVCDYGTVRVPELVRLERYAQVQHLVSTVEGRLRPDVTHLDALAACFPGGSITGAPKIRAMEIIDELEPTARGPYTGCLGYLGFNRESQLSIIIRTALCVGGTAYFHVGAGIVADSVAEAEFEETLTKAGGFLAALGRRDLQAVPPSGGPTLGDSKHSRNPSVVPPEGGTSNRPASAWRSRSKP
jgi:para-aminobenzoate synthetase component I